MYDIVYDTTTAFFFFSFFSLSSSFKPFPLYNLRPLSLTDSNAYLYPQSMYESENSSVASSSFGEQDEMEHFMNRCSICFDAHLDFCLEYCRDQYCLDCFQKYIGEISSALLESHVYNHHPF